MTSKSKLIIYGVRAAGYQDLPEYPEIPPDPSARNVEPPKPAENPWKKDVKPFKVKNIKYPDT